jgi:hypothetical protein
MDGGWKEKEGKIDSIIHANEIPSRVPYLEHEHKSYNVHERERVGEKSTQTIKCSLSLFLSLRFQRQLLGGAMLGAYPSWCLGAFLPAIRPSLDWFSHPFLPAVSSIDQISFDHSVLAAAVALHSIC